MKNINPGMIFGVLAGLILGFLLFKGCSKPKTVEVVKKETVTVEVHDTVHHYPDDIPIPKPVVKVVEKRIFVADQDGIDSLVRYYDKELADCMDRHAKAQAELLSAEPGEVLVIDEKVKEYSDKMSGRGWSMDWKIGSTGDLKYFEPDIKLTSTSTVYDNTKNFSLGLVFSGYGNLNGNFDYGGGISFGRKWMNVSAIVIPNQEAAVLSFNPTIRW